MGARLQRVQTLPEDRRLSCWAMRLDAVSERLGAERSQGERVPVGGCAGWE